jgi:hypothetical protein
VPVLAAGLADVLVVDANPLVGGGIGGHLLDQLAVFLLDDGVVVEVRLHLVDAEGEPVADLLELVDGQHPRSTHSRNGEVDALAREGRAEQPGEGELHGGDLPAQVSARLALVVLVEDGVEALGGSGRNQVLPGHDAFEQLLRHQVLL